MEKPTRAELLAEYARKPAHRFAQIDAHINQDSWDDMIRPDEEGDGLTAGVRYDLANSDCVRVRFPDGTAREDVARALRKILAWVEQGDLWEVRRNGEGTFFGRAEPVDWEAHNREAAAQVLLNAEYIISERAALNKVDDIMRRAFDDPPA